MNNSKPLITIITITYNLLEAGRRESFHKCLESIHNQTYSNIEHIIIDGASTDGTIEMLENYKQKGWITYFSEPDTGIYNAFNKGIERANGEYIAFLNSDDFYHSNLGVEKSVDALIKSGADFSYADDFILNEKKPKKSRRRKGRIYIAFHNMPFCHQTMFTKKSTLVNIGKFDETYKSAGDYDLIIRLLLNHASHVKVNHLFCTFRLGGTSDLNVRRSQKECFKSYVNNLKFLYPIKPVDAHFMTYYAITPIPLLKKLLQYFSNTEQLLYILFSISSFIKYWRKKFIRITLSHRIIELKLFGKILYHKNLKQDL